MINDSFPLISVKLSSRDPPFMPPWSNTFVTSGRRPPIDTVKQRTWSVKTKSTLSLEWTRWMLSKTKKRCTTRDFKGWWEKVNRITGMKSQGTRVSSVIFPDVVNSYFHSINTNDTSEAPELLSAPPGTRVPTVDEYDVLNLLIHRKRTAPGPDGTPSWFWRDYAPNTSLRWSPELLTVLSDSIPFHLCGN